MKIFFIVLTATILLGANNTAFGVACTQCMNGTPYPSGCTDLNNVCGSGGGSSDKYEACDKSECGTNTPAATTENTDSYGNKYTCNRTDYGCHKPASIIGGGEVVGPLAKLLNSLSPIQSAAAANATLCRWWAKYGNCKCSNSSYTYKDGVCLKQCTTNADCSTTGYSTAIQVESPNIAGQKVTIGYRYTCGTCTDGLCTGDLGANIDVSCITNGYYKSGNTCLPCSKLSFNDTELSDNRWFGGTYTSTYNRGLNNCGQTKQYGYGGATECRMSGSFGDDFGRGTADCQFY